VTARDLALYVGRRLLVIALLLVVMSFLIFSLLYLAPGSPVDSLLGLAPRTPETVAALRKQFHLDQSFVAQYLAWAKNAVHLDFGTSTQTSLAVTDELKERLPTSLWLGLYAFVLTILAGVTLGTLSALKRQSFLDRGIVTVTIVGLSTPAFVSGVLLLYVFASVLNLFPSSGTGEGFLDGLWHLTLPAVSLALIGTAFVAKHTRAATIAALDQDFVTFARARGLTRSEILFGYVLRNSLISVITIAGLILSFVITGAILVEVTFSLPGIGSLLVNAADTNDLPMIQGVAMVTAVVIMGANLLADLVHLAADPRIRLGRRA
jgi:peptide/nickel transport system permease protein